MKEALHASLPSLNFHFTALPMNSYFHPSCDQDCLRKTLLITAKAVFLENKTTTPTIK